MQKIPQLLEETHRLHPHGRVASERRPPPIQAIRRVEEGLLDIEAGAQPPKLDLQESGTRVQSHRRRHPLMGNLFC